MRPSELTRNGALAVRGVAAATPHLHREIAISAAFLAVARCDPAEALRRLDATDAGMEEAEAGRRLRRFGANQVARERRTGILHELIDRTNNPLNGLLLTLSVVSYFLGDVRAAAIIATMVVLSIATAFVQEHRSNQAAAKLRALVKTTASVKRRGGAPRPSKVEGFVEIPMEEIVPGDVVALSAGDMIPADLRLLSAKDLFINQSTLTGEAMPIEKVRIRRHAVCHERVRSAQCLLHGQQRGQRLRHRGDRSDRRKAIFRPARRYQSPGSACRPASRRASTASPG